jgi:hypothetical protein
MNKLCENLKDEMIRFEQRKKGWGWKGFGGIQHGYKHFRRKKT